MSKMEMQLVGSLEDERVALFWPGVGTLILRAEGWKEGQIPAESKPGDCFTEPWNYTVSRDGEYECRNPRKLEYVMYEERSPMESLQRLRQQVFNPAPIPAAPIPESLKRFMAAIQGGSAKTDDGKRLGS